MVAAPGMPVYINEPGAVTITIGGRPRPVHAVTLVDAPPSLPPGRADAGWVWLTGTPGPFLWQESTAPTPPAGSFEVRWCEPLTKAEFDAATLCGADGKPLPPSDRPAAAWLDAVNPGWEALSRAALAVVTDVPEDQHAALAAALRVPLATPGDHWRSALLLRALRPSTPAAADFQPKALNTLARQQGDMWAGAIGRLCRADAAMGLQVARRLVQVGYLPTSDTGGSWGVLWCEADPHVLDTLITSPPSGLATAATSFLAGQPTALAWVRDDAGLRDPLAGASIATVGAVSLFDQRTIGSLSLTGQAAGEPTPFRPFIGQLLSAAPAQQRAGGGSVATVKLATTTLTLPVGTTPTPAAPPGVLLGPFCRDWTLASFRRQQPEPISGVAGSLVLSASAGGTAGTHPSWIVYLECRTDAGADIAAERLRIWAGPTGSPVLALEIGPEGAAASRVGIAPQTAVSRIPGGWCATVTLPAAAVESSGTLRLAVEHVAANGLRSAWPRAMMPWQNEPGRLSIDTAAWNRELKP